jgi:hypothetical protein
MKVNFSIFPDQHNHQIWTSRHQSGQLRRLSEEQIHTSSISKVTSRYSSIKIV